MAPVTTSSRDAVGQWPTLTTDKVAQEFIQIYYNLLNRSPGYLHQLYGDESTAIISEAQDEGPPHTVHASSKEKIKQLVVMFSDVHVVLTTCTPQYSLDGSLLLLVTGRMMTKADEGEDVPDSERLFTQAFVLAKQEKGFYVRTDTLQVHSRGCSFKFLKKAAAPPPPRPVERVEPPMPAPAPVPAPQSPPRQPQRKIPSETVQHTQNQEHYSMQQVAPHPVSPQQVQPKPQDTPVAPPEAPKPKVETPETPPPSPKNLEPPVPEPRSKPAEQGNGNAVPAPDQAVQPPTNAVAPITKPSNPAAKLSYAQVLRQKMAAAAGQAQGGAPARESKPMVQLASPAVPETAPKPAVQSPKAQPAPETRPAPAGGQPQGEHNLFVCRLPLGIAVAKVAEIFSTFGEVVEPGAVRVFSGPKNCFAHVKFDSDATLHKALNAKIEIGEETLKMEIWRKREGPSQHQRGGRQGSGGRQTGGGGRGSGGPGRQSGGRGGRGGSARQGGRRQGSWDIA